MTDYAPHGIVRGYDGRWTHLVCTCGQKELGLDPDVDDPEPICRHDRFRRNLGLRPRESGIVIGFDNVVSHDQGFSGLLQPTRVSVNPSGELEAEPLHPSPVRVNFDLSNNDTPLHLQLRNGRNLEIDLDNLHKAFGNIKSLKSLTRVIATARTRSFFVALDKVAAKRNPESRARHGLLYFVTDFRGIEPLWQAGFAPATIESLPNSVLRQNEGRLHNRLGIPRRFVDLVRNEILRIDDYHKIANFAYNYLGLSEPTFHNSVVWNLVEPMRIHCQWAINWLYQAFLLVHRHNYDYETLKEYITHNARDLQGIVNPVETLHLLSEYADMLTMCEDNENKWPKYLKVAYDIAAMQIIQIYDEQLNEKFKEFVATDEYQSLCDQVGDFVILAPDSVEDMQYEGAYLSHSADRLPQQMVYGQDDNKVYFLRYRNDSKTPLVTLNYRFGLLYQARGYRNRAVNAEEKQAIQRWAEIHNIEIGPTTL